MRRSLLPVLLSLTFSCVETPTPDSPEPETTDDAEIETIHQPALDDGPNWFVAGGDGLVEPVGGTDGEPDELTGRFALGGSRIVDAESGADRWVVVGDGETQPLDDSALRLREARDALESQAITFIEPAPIGWLIGGAEGRLQLLDEEGEPTAITVQVLEQTTINHAAFNGNSWLAVGENGNVVVLNRDTLAVTANPQGQAADGGKPVVAAVADPGGSGTPPFLAFSADSAIPVQGLGGPLAPVLIENGLQITTAEFSDGKVYIGTSDGRVGVADYGSTPSFSFTDVVSGAAITRLVSNGTDWIALGENGQAQRFDADGAAIGEAVQVSGAGRPLVGAHWAGDRWLIVVGEIGFVAFVDETLAAPRTLTEVLSGARINAAGAGSSDVLVAGSDGYVQLLDDRGDTVSQPMQLSGAGALHAVSWNGNAWLVAGDAGFAQVVDANGEPQGQSSLLDGDTIRFAAWSGEFWLIGGDGGKYQLVRSDGTASAAPRALDGAETLHDARWSGTEWLMVGVSTTGSGIAALTVPDQNVEPTPTEFAEMGTLRAVDFNGIEWLVAGDGGLIQRVSAQGMTIDAPMDVLSGFAINDIYYNGVNYIVVGEFGAVRRLGQDYLPLRAPIAVLDRQAARAVEWTVPRGFPNGPCLTNDTCYQAVCVGGLGQGRCCEAACDRPCESCFENDTGEPDGTCAPVVEGKGPPSKPNGQPDACRRQSEGTCGFTGVCDGAGECQFYGAEVECAEEVCSLGKFRPLAVCDGTGSCGTVDEVDCAPYAGCTSDGCLDSCNADEDCVSGFVCQETECVEAPDDPDPEPEPGDDASNEDDGCCATIPSGGDSPRWLVLLIVGYLVTRRL